MSYPNLSEQEARFLRLIEDGRTPTEIAALFGLSMSRVRKVIRSLRDKFDVDQIGDLADAASDARDDLAGRLRDDLSSGRVTLPDDGRIHIDPLPVRE